MKSKIIFISFFILLQLSISFGKEVLIKESEYTGKNKIGNLTEEDDEDEKNLRSLSIHEAPDFIMEESEVRNMPVPDICPNDAIVYNYTEKYTTVNKMGLMDVLYFGTDSPYAPNSTIKWRFKIPDFDIKLCCWIRIRTTPGCRDNTLSIFSGKGHNTGTRHCGWWTHLTLIRHRRVKAVFRSGPDPFTNRGFCCRVSVV